MVAARAPPEDRRNFRRLDLFMVPKCQLQHEEQQKQRSLILLDLNVFQSHLYSSACVNLQGDHALTEFG